VSPSGTTVTLFSSQPARFGNLSGATFDDSGPLRLSQSRPPYTGRYRPDQPLVNLRNENPNGTWQLRVSATATLPASSGKLNAWSLTLQTTAEPNAVSDASGNYAFPTVWPGSYSIREVLAGGWTRTLPTGGVYAFTMTSGQALTGIDFGNRTGDLVPTSAMMTFTGSSMTVSTRLAPDGQALLGLIDDSADDSLIAS
jgi:hypothetical protein